MHTYVSIFVTNKAIDWLIESNSDNKDAYF